MLMSSFNWIFESIFQLKSLCSFICQSLNNTLKRVSWFQTCNIFFGDAKKAENAIQKLVIYKSYKRTKASKKDFVLTFCLVGNFHLIKMLLETGYKIFGKYFSNFIGYQICFLFFKSRFFQFCLSKYVILTI